eukprot:g7213.t1
MSDLCSLGKDNFSRILRNLTASECGRFACVSRASRELVNDDDAIWESYFLSEFGDANMKEQNDNAKFKDLFNAKASARILWTKAKNWHNNDDWPLLLAEGVEEEVLDEVESNLGLVLPLDVKEVYRMHNGQRRRSKVREFDIDTIIQKSGVYTCYDPRSDVNGVYIATPIFLDLENVLRHTIELRDYYNHHIWRNMNLRKQRKLKKERKRGGVIDMDIISSSVVYAEISCDPLKQLLLLKCDTHDVYLWQYPSRLIQIPTRSKYGWFAIWLEGLTGFDENENSCQVPLSWYLIQEWNTMVPLFNECCTKVQKQITLSGVERQGCGLCGYSDLTRYQFSVCEFNENDILFAETSGSYSVPQFCSIASKISKPFMCDVFSRYEEDELSYYTTIDKSEWFITICFESVDPSEDLAIDSNQDTLQEMIIAEQTRGQDHTQREKCALFKSKQRKRNSSVKQSILKRRNTCRALSQQISRYSK